MRVFILSLLVVAAAPAFSQSDGMTLVGFLDPRPQGYADIWGYVGSNGREYALVNARDGGGLSVIDVTDELLVEEDYIPGSGSGSDVEVYSHYAYVSDDFGPTQIVDLTDPENPVLTTSFGSGVHTLTVAGDHLYTQGGSGNGGVLIYSLTNPEAPAFVGQYQPHYIHDILVRGDTLYAAGIFGEGVDIVDLSDRANPQLIERFNYPGSGAHNVCATESGSYIFVGDEIGSGRWTRVFDVRDPHNVELVAEIVVDPISTVHNCHVKGDLLYIGYYDGYGARVYDISDPTAPDEIAYFETGSGMMWSVYPHLPSGKIIGALYYSGGVYVFNLDVVVPNEGGPEASGGLALLPATPNPFGAATTLRLSLDRTAARARLAVYDALGRPVAVLHEGPLAAGEHTLRFESAGLPSGVYLVRLEADGRIATQRLTLMR